MDKKQRITDILLKLKTVGKTLGHIIFLAIALIAGFFIGYYYWVMMDRTQDSPFKKVKKTKTTSVAKNDRNELMIIDRATGVYTVYQDSVGTAIFEMYAKEKYAKAVEVSLPNKTK